MQQQSNIIGAMPYSSITATLLPASKTMSLGDFTYLRRVTLSTTGTVAAGFSTAITITIVPQTGTPSDTLLKESLSMIRSAPNCGTVLGMASC
jgi:hypothetical protein